IFVKTRKTAGTSIEVFLARHLGPDAVITPVFPSVAGHRPQHHADWSTPLPEMLRQRSLRPALSDLRRRRTYFNHIPAERICERVGRRVWDSYFKFCFERDPWDKLVSGYYYRLWEDPEMSFADFVLTQPLPTDFGLYSIDGEVTMDFVGRLDELTAALGSVLDRIGIDAPAELTREKSGVRRAYATREVQ